MGKHETAIPFVYLGDDKETPYPPSYFNEKYKGEKLGFNRIAAFCPVCDEPVGFSRFSKNDPSRGYYISHQKGTNCPGCNESLWHKFAKHIPQRNDTLYIPVPAYSDGKPHITSFSTKGKPSGVKDEWFARKVLFEPVTIIETEVENSIETGQHPDNLITAQRNDGSLIKIALEIRYKHAKNLEDVQHFANIGLPVLEITIGDVVPKDVKEPGWEEALRKRVLGLEQDGRKTPREWLYYPNVDDEVLKALKGLVNRKIAIDGKEHSHRGDLSKSIRFDDFFKRGSEEGRYREYNGLRLPDFVTAELPDSLIFSIQSVSQKAAKSFDLITDIGKVGLQFTAKQSKCPNGYTGLITTWNDCASTPAEMLAAMKKGLFHIPMDDVFENMNDIYERRLFAIIDIGQNKTKPCVLSEWRCETGKVNEGSFVFDLGECSAEIYYLWAWKEKDDCEDNRYIGKSDKLLATPEDMHAEAEKLLRLELSAQNFKNIEIMYQWNDADPVARLSADSQVREMHGQKITEYKEHQEAIRLNKDTRWLIENDPEIRKILARLRRDKGTVFPHTNPTLTNVCYCTGPQWHLYFKMLGEPRTREIRQKAYSDQMCLRGWSSLEAPEGRKCYKLAEYGIIKGRVEIEVGLVDDIEHADDNNCYECYIGDKLHHDLAQLFYTEEEWIGENMQQELESYEMFGESLFDI